MAVRSVYAATCPDRVPELDLIGHGVSECLRRLPAIDDVTGQVERGMDVRQR
jgi:hypothetical protein